MEHSELVNDMWRMECLSTCERLSMARRRRSHQLKLWAQRERELLRTSSTERRHHSPVSTIRFTDSVVLLEAASRNDVEEVRRLLKKGVSPDSTNEDGLTALHQCCIDDNEEMMKLLLEFGANVNAEDSEKWTPLHAAATCGHLHLVKHLIANGAELLAVNADGNMPYDICEDEASLEYIEGEMAKRGVTQALIDETRASTESRMLSELKRLAAKGGDLEKQDQQHATYLHIAAANGYLKVVEFLLDHHVSTDVRDVDDWQPIHAAACWGHLDVVEMLVQNGADLSARTKHEETPVDMCEDPEMRERLVELQKEQERRRVRRGGSRGSAGGGSGVRRVNSNTRVRSVRRTSVRDKGLTAKRDARIEHNLRLLQDKGEVDGLCVGDVVSDKVDGHEPMVTGGRREPEGKDSDTISHCSEQSSRPTATASLEVPAEASFTEESNGKINIHVSVTINAGTLAELKRARALNRVNSPEPGSNSITSSTVFPTDSPKRFSGTTSETMVGDSKVTRCCTVL